MPLVELIDPHPAPLLLRDLFAGGDPGPIVGALAQVPELCQATLPFVRDGKSCWALLAIAQERYDDEDCYAIWATDISASKDAEEMLKQAAAQSDALADQKSNFLATISHEIRTPMQSIYGLLEMIELDKPSPNVLSMAKTARNSASGLLEILDDVLDFAKMDADGNGSLTQEEMKAFKDKTKGKGPHREQLGKKGEGMRAEGMKALKDKPKE